MAYESGPVIEVDWPAPELHKWYFVESSRLPLRPDGFLLYYRLI